MSQMDEVIQVVESISYDAENKGRELFQYAESIGRFVAIFSKLANGSNDASAQSVCRIFANAQKLLYKASKASLEASKEGYDWCEGNSPKLVKKKVKR